MPVTTLASSNLKYNWTVIQSMLAILNYLDQSLFIYKKQNQPVDFLKRHLVLDSAGHLKLVNTYLIDSCKRSLKRYTTKAFLHSLILSLFPANGDRKSCPNKCQFPKSHTAPEWVHTQFCAKWKAEKFVARS
jgi:hypothetical protein